MPRSRILTIIAVVNLIGLFVSVVGGVLLFYFLELKPSEFRLVKQHDGGMALCLKDKRVESGYGGGLIVTDEPCPEMDTTGPTAEVVSSKPAFATWGLRLIIAGFVFQLPAAISALCP
jgi:hypothetical protein